MPISGGDILTIKNLFAYYDKAEILRGVSIRVREGEVTTILGPNGAGKTTLIKSICGLVKTKGKIFFLGKDISNLKTHDRIRMGIAVCPEGRRIFPNMTVKDNLFMGSVFNKNFDERLEFIFNLFPRLKERLNQKAGTLSGGEQQMLAIARGLMSAPDLLILDEPSLGLAPKLTLDIFGTIKKLKEEGLTMLLVEQNVHLSLAIADYAYVMAEGRIKMEGSAEELEKSEEIKKAYLGL